jgi:hypothetical protein
MDQSVKIRLGKSETWKCGDRKRNKLNIMHFPCNDIVYIDVCIANLLHDFTSVVFACTCFGLEFRPSSGSYKLVGRMRSIWQLMYK